MPDSITPDGVHDDFSAAAVEQSIEDVIRLRAYAIWEARGGGDGHALDDWLAAETGAAEQPK